MRDPIVARMRQLQAEHERGQKVLAELEEKRAQLTRTLLRIQGALQVLEELLSHDDAAAEEGGPATSPNGAAEVAMPAVPPLS